jgi:hypothetical protein
MLMLIARVTNPLVISRARLARCVIFLDNPFFRLYIPEKKTNGHIFLVRFLCPHNAILPDFDTRTDYKKQCLIKKLIGTEILNKSFYLV